MGDVGATFIRPSIRGLGWRAYKHCLGDVKASALELCVRERGTVSIGWLPWTIFRAMPAKDMYGERLDSWKIGVRRVKQQWIFLVMLTNMS